MRELAGWPSTARQSDARTPHNPFDVRTLDSSHVGFLVHPDEPASVIAG